MSDSILAECRELLLDLAPELKEQPLYVVDAGRLRDLPRPNDCTHGWAHTGTIFDVNVADRLGAEYLGPGAMFAMDVEAIRQYAAPSLFDRYYRTVALHEGAHILPALKMTAPKNVAAFRKIQHDRMKRMWAAPPAEPTDERDPHDARFVRRCCHLMYRAIARGVDITTINAFGPYPWLATPEVYVYTLLAELAMMAKAPFAVIQALNPPAMFTRQWAIDLENYKRHFPKGESCQT